MSPYSYWFFAGLSLTFCGVTVTSTGTKLNRARDDIIEEIEDEERDCSEITPAVETILQAVHDRSCTIEDCEISSTKTEIIIQTVKPECPTSLSPQPMACLPGTTASGKESSKGNRSSIIVLGLFTGILFATLVVVIVGWIVTCVVLKVKLTEKDQQKRSLLTASTSQNVTTEPIPARNIEPLPVEDVIYNQIDETQFGETMVDLKPNEAYNLSRVTG